MITGTQHPDYAHRGEIPYVIDGEPELTIGETTPSERREIKRLLLFIVAFIVGIAVGFEAADLAVWFQS